jgi:hypothetical protein
MKLLVVDVRKKLSVLAYVALGTIALQSFANAAGIEDYNTQQLLAELAKKTAAPAAAEPKRNLAGVEVAAPPAAAPAVPAPAPEARQPAPVRKDIVEGQEPAVGVTLDQLKNISRNLQVRLVDHKLTFSGMIPKRCLVGDANIEKKYDTDLKRHLITVHLARECEQGYTPDPSGEVLVPLSNVLRPVELDDASGKIYIRALPAGDAVSPERTDDKLTDKEIRDSKGTAYEIVSKEDKDLAEMKRKADKLLIEAADRCSNGDVAAVDEAVSRLTDLGVDASNLLEQANKNQLQKLKNELARAKTAEDAQDILDKAKSKVSGDDEAMASLQKAYIAQRWKLLDVDVKKYEAEESSVKARDVSSKIQELKNDLQAMDEDVFEANKSKFDEKYKRLSNAAGRYNRYGDIGFLADRGKEFASAEDRGKYEEIALDASLADVANCTAKSKKDLEICKAKKKTAQDRFARAKKNTKDQDAREELAAREAELFGSGYGGQYVQGFGFTKGGSIDQSIMASFQQSQYEQAQAMYEKQMSRYYGSSMMGGGNPYMMGGGNPYMNTSMMGMPSMGMMPNMGMSMYPGANMMYRGY